MQTVKVNLYRPHKSQEQVIHHKARFKVCVMGRRFGKTTMAVNELLYHALLTPKSNLWYIAPTYRQAKEIAWRMLKDSYHALPKELQLGTNESELWVEVGNGSRISLKGADNEDSLRGSPLHGVIIDEVDSIGAWQELWSAVLSPALVDYKGWAWFIGTPKGYGNLYQLSNTNDPEYASFHFTSYDNPHLPHEEIDKEKARLPEDIFAQEFMADFRKYSGLVYKEFNRDIHLLDSIDLPGGDAYYRSMDFGAVNPTVCLWTRVDRDDTFYVYDEYYETEKTTDYHAGQILAKYPQTNFTATFGDPSGKQEILDYARWGLHITPANKQILDMLTGSMKSPDEESWVKHGINEMRKRFQINPITGKPRIFIHERCKNLIRELELYRWEESSEGRNVREKPVKAHDHSPDALRYLGCSYQRRPVYRQRPVELRKSRVTAY